MSQFIRLQTKADKFLEINKLATLKIPRLLRTETWKSLESSSTWKKQISKHFLRKELILFPPVPTKIFEYSWLS